MEKDKKEKFSYSKLDCYESCGWKYKLTYIDKHQIYQKAIATDFGTLVHSTEEQIAKDIIANDNEPVFLMNYNKYIDMFAEGVYKIKERYPNHFYEKDKNNLNYADKANAYIEKGVYRLRDYLSNNRNLRIKGIEQHFNLEYNNYIFTGFIDRVFEDINTGEILIEDIKTYSAPLTEDKLKTPLQFVIYTLAAKELYQTDNISCAYEIILCDCKQKAGSKGYITRGIKKLNSLFTEIENQNYTPKPSPLCYWCPFSKTTPDQLEEAKNLCPYYCNWTKEDKKNFSVNYEWMGLENHSKILEEFIRQQDKKNSIKIEIKSNSSCIINNERHFIKRRI